MPALILQLHNCLLIQSTTVSQGHQENALLNSRANQGISIKQLLTNTIN
jgi:hypothetical protein